MKIVIVFGLLIVLTTTCYAQDGTVERIQLACKCPQLSGSFGSEQEAKIIVNRLAQLVNIKVDYVFQLNCTANAEAIHCNKKNFILYNNVFMEDMKRGSQWGERFVMAHEIGHLKIWNTSLEREYFKVKQEDWTVYVKYLKEFQADALATMILYKQQIPMAEMQKVWKQYEHISKLDPMAWSSTHPAIKYRSLLTRNLLVEMHKVGNERIDVTKGILNKSKKMSAVWTNQFLATQSKSKFGDSLTADEKQFWNFVRKKRSVSIEPTFTGVFHELPLVALPQPHLENKKSLPAQFTSFNYSAGAKFTLINWFLPFWFETTAQYKSLGFSTYTMEDNLPVVTEDFRWKGIQVIPQIQMNTIGDKYNYDIRKIGLFASVGYAVQIPFMLSYNNYLSGFEGEIATPLSSNWMYRVGVMQVSRNPLQGNWSVGITMQNQRIVTGPVKIKVPQFGISISGRLW